MKTFEFTKKIEASTLAEVIDQAIYGASKYWADEFHVKGQADNKTQGEAMVEGKTLKLHDAEDDKWHNVTLNDILKGLALTDNTDFDRYDMYDAERVLQRAIFGKEVYA